MRKLDKANDKANDNPMLATDNNLNDESEVDAERAAKAQADIHQPIGSGTLGEGGQPGGAGGEAMGMEVDDAVEQELAAIEVLIAASLPFFAPL